MTPDNVMTDDLIWLDPPEKTCKHCGYKKSLCQCERAEHE